MTTRKFPREFMTSERHDDGLWHARYPSALQTLCGRVALAEALLGRRRAPTCGVCAKVARRFDRIDRSCPDYWRWEA